MRSIDFLSNNRISGDLIEFGVGTGNSLKWILDIAESKGYTFKHVYGVDTFEGFPETAGHESSSPFNFIEKGSRKASVPQVLRAIKAKKRSSEISLLQTNLEKENLEFLDQTALVHLDLDYSDPTLKALKIIEPTLQIGTVVMFDNYFFFRASDQLGERLALRNFERESSILLSEFFTYSWHGKAFVVSDIKSKSN
jgi:O-methyltransferase